MTATAKRTWFAVDVVVDPSVTEAVETALNELGALGTEIDSLRKKPTDPQTVTAFFDELPEETEVRDVILHWLAAYGFQEATVLSISRRNVEETDWLAEWKKHWKPTAIGRFIVAPPWEDVDDTDKIVIRIEPNMAFGTGTHDTTKLCLKAIGELYAPAQTFLDVGTGTGILAIAAAKLGGSKIFGCDTDADSVKIARENALLNEAGWIEFAEGPLRADMPAYDLVCANLTVDVIVPILDLLLAKTLSILLLSGILFEQKDIISSALSDSGVSHFTIERSGEWISVIIDRSESCD